MTHALCVLDKYDHRRTFSLRLPYCFFTAKAVTRTRLNVSFIRILPVWYPPVIDVHLSRFAVPLLLPAVQIIVFALY